MIRKLLLALTVALAGFPAQVLAFGSDVPITLAIETKAAAEHRADLHAEKRELVEERLSLAQPATPMAEGSKARFEVSRPYLSEAKMPITMAIETKAAPDQREVLHEMKRDWAVEREALLRPWAPGSKTASGMGS